MIAPQSEQKSQIEKDSFSLQKDNFCSPEGQLLLSRRATFTLPKGNFSIPIESVATQKGLLCIPKVVVWNSKKPFRVFLKRFVGCQNLQTQPLKSLESIFHL